METVRYLKLPMSLHAPRKIQREMTTNHPKAKYHAKFMLRIADAQDNDDGIFTLSVQENQVDQSGVYYSSMSLCIIGDVVRGLISRYEWVSLDHLYVDGKDVPKDRRQLMKLLSDIDLRDTEYQRDVWSAEYDTIDFRNITNQGAFSNLNLTNTQQIRLVNCKNLQCFAGLVIDSLSWLDVTTRHFRCEDYRQKAPVQLADMTKFDLVELDILIQED